MKITWARVLFLLFFLIMTGPVALSQITGGMLDPAMDVEGQPFCYFWHPNDVVGSLFAPVATEVTPEGYLYTGFGELMFFSGNPPEPVEQRIKTLHQGHLPVVQYSILRNGVRYEWSMFGADLGGELKGLPVNFVKVRVTNTASEQRAAFLSSAVRFAAPRNITASISDYRFAQRFDLIPKEYVEGQNMFNPQWNYSFDGNSLLREGRILYSFSLTPKPYQLSLTLGDRGLRFVRYFTGEIEGNPKAGLRLDEQTPVGVVAYRLILKPGESQDVTFKMPVVPVPAGSAAAKLLAGADYDQVFRGTVDEWEKQLSRFSLKFPEAKVQDYLLANTVFDLLAMDKVGQDYVPNVNKFQYHHFYGGSDTAHMLIALDYVGLSDIARKGFLYSLAAQRADGAFIIPYETTEYNYWESFGFGLWGWGKHYLLTRDQAFLRQIYPGVLKGMQWEMSMVAKDPEGLMPRTTIADDAMLKNARSTGQHMWMLVGIRNAVRLAEAMGDKQNAAAFQKEYDRFWKAFETQLNLQTKRSGGYIPPALERTLEGNDWDNLLTLYPEPLFEPFDPRVTASLKTTRATYVEGILDYVRETAMSKEDWPADLGEMGSKANRGEGYVFDPLPHLHYWHTPDNAQNALVRGTAEDQENAVKDLYALLVHTTSTHAPQEWGAYPWSTRDHGGNNLLPDGPASGKTIELVRNMIVREFKDELYLFSGLSPAWLVQGQTVEAREALTDFGPVSLVLEGRRDGFSFTFDPKFRQAPRQVVATIPWFFNTTRVEVDGQAVEVKDNRIVLSPGAHRVNVLATKKQTAELSYEKAVEDYKREYRRRYAEFLKSGAIQLK